MSDRLALVTGGAGLIGSHLTDLLLAEGWRVRVLDNLEPRTHGRGMPSWIAEEAELRVGDVRRRSHLLAALQGVDTVFHLAAYGGYMPELGKFFDVNCVGTGLLLETIRDESLHIRRIVLASSQAVYTEGAVACPLHGLRFPPSRDAARLAAGRFDVPCPECGGPARGAPTPERAPVGGETVYAFSKHDQERLALAWSRQTGVPVVALRFACTYGPRQSVYNPYTGVIAVFCTRLLNDLPPVLYEDGRQTRDLCYVGDIARACLIAAETSRLDGLAVNVGTGRPVAIHDLALILGDLLNRRIEPEIPGEYRPGEMRALTPDIGLARSAGFAPEVPLEEGLARCVAWLREQAPAGERFGASRALLKRRGVVQLVGARADRPAPGRSGRRPGPGDPVSP